MTLYSHSRLTTFETCAASIVQLSRQFLQFDIALPLKLY